MRVLVCWWVLHGLAACSAPEVCQDRTASGDLHVVDGGDDTSLSSAVASDSIVLSQAAEQELVRFEATLGGLPELWQIDTALLESSLLIQFSVRYESEPFGSDGRTEMPVVNVRVAPFEGVADLAEDSTGRYPGPAGSALSIELFPTCLNDGDPGCCPYGSQECTVPTTVTFERVEGSPFQPIVLDYAIAAEARVSTCPLRKGMPSLATRRLEP